jgi:thymidine kinase
MLILEQERESSMAKLYFRYGAMNSGKTIDILKVAYNYEERGHKILIIKPKVDTKGNDHIVSRIGLDRKVDKLISADDSIIEEVKNDINNIACILVDEAQFLTVNQIDELYVVAKLYEVPVISYGLRTDFKTNSFPGSKRLLEIADELEEMVTICRCGEKARFNARKINGEFTLDGGQVAIDNEDDVTYESLCGECYLKLVKKETIPKVYIKQYKKV